MIVIISLLLIVWAIGAAVGGLTGYTQENKK